jgi:hypothetical protein
VICLAPRAPGTVCARVALPAAQGTPNELRSTRVRPDASSGPSTSPLGGTILPCAQEQLWMKRYFARVMRALVFGVAVLWVSPKGAARHQAEVSPILGDRKCQAQRSVCRLTIVGGVREVLLVWRLGRWEHCAPEAPCRPL